MLVDDDKDDQMIFMSAVSDINTHIDCKCFDSAEQGLEALKTTEQHPDCIFLDLNLPFMHGFELLELLKGSAELNSIPIIIYSTSSREADRIKAMQMGALKFFSKPTSFTELKRGISELLTGMGKCQ
jgi:DNA-binding response OmpR family regulator